MVEVEADTADVWRHYDDERVWVDVGQVFAYLRAYLLSLGPVPVM